MGNQEIAAVWKLGVMASRAWWRYQKIEHLCENGGYDSMHGFIGATTRIRGATACYRLLRPNLDFWGGVLDIHMKDPLCLQGSLSNGYMYPYGYALMTQRMQWIPLWISTHPYGIPTYPPTPVDIAAWWVDVPMDMAHDMYRHRSSHRYPQTYPHIRYRVAKTHRIPYLYGSLSA